MEGETLRWAVGVFHLQQRVRQRHRTSDGNQQRAGDVQDGRVAVGWEETKQAKYASVKLCHEAFHCPKNVKMNQFGHVTIFKVLILCNFIVKFSSSESQW